MVLCYPSTPRKLAMSVACFVSGGIMFGYGLHLWYVNAAPQQARIKKRNDIVKDFLRKKYGYKLGADGSLSQPESQADVNVKRLYSDQFKDFFRKKYGNKSGE